jgi:dual specificity phosphatase 3
MANLDFITPNLATGGDLPNETPDAIRDLEEWQQMGITHVIDNRLEWDDSKFVAQWAPDMSYLHNGVDDHGERMPDGWFNEGVPFALEAFAEPNSKVLVHCHMGINRGPSLAYAVLLASGWDPIEALTAIRSARPIAGLLYAEDALDWHHQRQDTPRRQRIDEFRQLDEWREQNWIDVVRIIRGIRALEAN